LSLEADHSWTITLFSIGWILLALVTAFFSRHVSIQSETFEKGFYLNEASYYGLKNIGMPLARMTARADKKWIDGFIHALAYGQVLVAHVTGWIDRACVDGTVNGFASMVRGVGSMTRSFQDGKIQLYIFWSIFTIIIFLIWTLL
jgi:NADH-quinone oxidoreductase subunit L